MDTSLGEQKWGMPLTELYRLAVSFYKQKNGKILFGMIINILYNNFHPLSTINPPFLPIPGYEDNLKLVAFTQQAAHGQFNSATAPPVGVLDVIGRDRRVAWQNLGTISKSQSLEGFIDLLDRLCPQFRAHVEAVQQDMAAQKKLRDEEAKQKQAELEKEREQQAEVDRLEEKRSREELQRRELQSALNQQTFHQFKVYAEKQYPGNPEQQAVLIRQLQMEHYHQYMQQLQAQYQEHSTTSVGSNTTIAAQQMQNEGVLMGERDVENGGVGGGGEHPHQEGEASDGEGSQGADSEAVIERANMWTRSDMKAFKLEVSAGKGDGVIRVGHGETVTVRVPTHEGGSCLFWEFATDSHDIGFGVYFEWAKPATTEVSVHVSESDDEDDEDPGEEGDGECEYSPPFDRP